jgi:hypothetical protein
MKDAAASVSDQEEGRLDSRFSPFDAQLLDGRDGSFAWEKLVMPL